MNQQKKLTNQRAWRSLVGVLAPLAALALILALVSLVEARPAGPEATQDSQNLAPVWKFYYDGKAPATVFVVHNMAGAPANLTYAYYDYTDGPVASLAGSIQANGSVTIDVATLSVPDSFWGVVSINADQPIVAEIVAPALLSGAVRQPGGSPIPSDVDVCVLSRKPADTSFSTVGCTVHISGTDQFGFPLSLLPGPDVYTLVARSPWSMAPLKDSVPVTFTFFDQTAPISLGPVTLTYPSLTGEVYEPDNLTPAVGGWVSAYKLHAGTLVEVASVPYSATYELGGLPDGPIHVIAYPEEDSIFGASEPATVVITPGSQYDPAAVKFYSLTLTPSNLTGTVVYPDGSPVTWAYSGSDRISWAEVNVFKPDGTHVTGRSTASWGEFGFSLPPNIYSVRALPQAALAVTYTHSIPKPVRAPTETQTGPLTLTYPSFEGVVTDPAGQPISGCLDVVLFDGGGNWVDCWRYCSNEHRPFRFGGLPIGDYQLVAKAPDEWGFLSTDPPLSFSVEEGSQYLPTATQFVSLPLNAPQLEVFVTDPAGAPLAAHVVVKNERDYEEWDDSSPHIPAVFNRMVEGQSYWVTASPLDRDIPRLAASASQQITIGLTTVAITLELRTPNIIGKVTRPEGADLPGYVYNSDGDQVAPIWFWIHNTDDSVDITSLTNVSGEFGLVLPAGDYKLQAYPVGNLVYSYTHSMPQPFQVSYGMTLTRDLHAVRLTYPSLVGQVYDPAGQVVSDCLNIWLEEAASGDWATDMWHCSQDPADHPYLLGGVPGGYYRLNTSGLPRLGFYPPSPTWVYIKPGSQYDPAATQPIDIFLTDEQLVVLVKNDQLQLTSGYVVVGNEWGERDRKFSAPGRPARFGGLEAGQYWIEAWPVEEDTPGLANSVKEWVTLGDDPINRMSGDMITRELALRLPDIIGTVKTPEEADLPPAYDEDGLPVLSPVSVYVHSDDGTFGIRTTTNPTGAFSLALPPLGGYGLTVWPQWSLVATYTRSLDEWFELSPTTTRPLDLDNIRLTYPRLVGVVVDDNGQRVSTSVNLWKDDYTYSDEGDARRDGPEGEQLFRFGGMPAGHYLVQAAPPEDNPRGLGSSDVYEFDVMTEMQYLPTNTEYITLVLRVANFVGDLRFPPDYQPSDRVCPPDGCPAPGIRVELHSEDWTYGADASSGDNGRFAFGGLQAGVTYTLDFFLPDKLQADWKLLPSVSFTLSSPDQQISAMYHLQPAPRTKLVYGQVVYEDGAPVGDLDNNGQGDARIYAYREGSADRRETGNNLDGTYGFYLRGGLWRLGVQPAQPNVDWYFNPVWERWVEFSLDETLPETHTLVFTVTRATFYTVTGVVLDPDGNPPPLDSVWVEICTDDGQCFESSVGPSGDFRAWVLPGAYHIWVYADPAFDLYPPLNNGFALVVNSDKTVTIQLRSSDERSARVSGRVIISPTNLGLSGVEVQARTDQGDWASASSITDGVYALSMFPGHWHANLALTPEQQDLYVVDQPEVREGDIAASQMISNVNFYVRQLDAVIRGRLVDESGSLLSDVDAVVFAKQCDGQGCRTIQDSPAQGGNFALSVLGGYTYTLEVWLPSGGYMPGPDVPAQVYVSVGGTVSGVQLTLIEAGTRIHGYLMDGDTLELVQIDASVHGVDPQGVWVEDVLWPDKSPYDYNLYVPTPADQPVTWTVGLWVNPSTGYIVDPAHPNPTPVVVEPGDTEVGQVLYVKQLDTHITGTVMLDSAASAPARHIWVYAKGEPGADSDGLYFEAQTDDNGYFDMPVLPGDYLVSAYQPPDADFDAYLAPSLQAWHSEADNPINLAFYPKAMFSLLPEISGGLAVSPSGSISDDANILVFGWAEDGQTAWVTGSLASGYHLPVITATTWHLWAAYEDLANNVYYSSQEAVVEMISATVSGLDLLLEQAGFELPDPICTDVDPSSFTRIALPARGDLPEPLLEVPAGAFSDTVQICATPAMAVPGGHGLVGFAYEMEARDSLGNLITANFNKKVRFIFYLNQAALPDKVDPEDLLPVYYSTARQEWVTMDDVFVDAEDLFVTGKVNHFTRMGTMSPAAGEQATIQLNSVTASGPLTGVVGAAYAFTAAIQPPTATLPVTYTWQASGQTEVVTVTSALSHTVVFTWAVPGLHVITVTAANAAGPVSDTHTVLIGAPPQAAFTPSAVQATVGQTITFTNASSGTAPLTYLWRFGDGLTSTLASPTHAYTAAAVYTITLTASNAYGADSASAVIRISDVTPPQRIFLPLVLKAWQP